MKELLETLESVLENYYVLLKRDGMNPEYIAGYPEAQAIAEKHRNQLDTLSKPSVVSVEEDCKTCIHESDSGQKYCGSCEKGIASKPSVEGLTIICDFCHTQLTEFGGLIFSPPDKDNKVSKIHMCKKCYMNYQLKPSVEVLDVSTIEKEIDKEYYLSDYNDDLYANDFREYKARRERLAQAIYNLYHPKAR